MRQGVESCVGCLWKDQCGNLRACEFYTPVDSDTFDEGLYEEILRENMLEYEELVEEQTYDGGQ